MRKLFFISLLLLLTGRHAFVQGGTVRTVCASGCAYTTIASATAAATAPDTIIVYENYTANEAFETTKGGFDQDNRLTYIGVGATIQQFRFRHPYVTLRGFDITGYSGSNASFVRIEPQGDYCIIEGNTFRNGMYLSSTSFAFDGPTKTLTNAAGGFLAAGFEAGATTYFASFDYPNVRPNNHDNNDANVAGETTASTYTYQIVTIQSVTDTVITFTSAADIFTESGVTGTIYTNSSTNVGLYGIMSIDSSSTGTADNCVIRKNHFTDLAGPALSIKSHNTLITQNTFDHLNGWRLYGVTGTNNAFTYNTFTDSPRWPNFILPSAGFLSAAGLGTWDMYDTIFESQVQASSIQTDNNIIEHNFIMNVDEQFSNVTSYTAGLKANGMRFRYNVFVDVEMQGSFTRTNTLFERNTFYLSAQNSPHNVNFGYSDIGSGNHSDPNPTVIKGNAFISSGDMTCSSRDGADCLGPATPTSKAAKGWYNNDDPRPGGNPITPGVTSDYNMVTGLASDGWPAKDATFTAEGQEVHGVNGGDPKFVNAADPLGPDGLPWTIDDGLRPKMGSPLCGAGEAGTDIGAYSCPPAESSTLKRVCASGCTYTTIQACATGAAVGTQCLVDAGTYAEHVQTAKANIYFKAWGFVSMRGFDVRHSNITIDGFDLTGWTSHFGFLIDLNAGGSHPGAYNATIINNTLHDTCVTAGSCGSPKVGGIRSSKSSGGGVASSGVTIRNNTFRNLAYIFVWIIGDDWVIEGNKMSLNNNYDFFYLQGSNTTIRRNIIGPSSQSADTGNHPDVIQVFDVADGSGTAMNNLFEENFVYNLFTAEQQVNQLNNSLAGTNGQVDDIHHLTFRRNVFAGITANSNNSIPYITYENNSFYRMAQNADGLSAGGYMSRGAADHFLAKNNVLLGGGVTANTTSSTGGFYAPSGEQFSIESTNLLITHELSSSCQSAGQGCPDAALVYADLTERGYIDVSGYATASARALTQASDLTLDAPLMVYQADAYTALVALYTAHDLFTTTFQAFHNYVSNAPSTGYAAKRADGCSCSATFTRFRFCEAAAQCNIGGLNGGDPKLQAGTLLTRGVLSIPYVLNGVWDATAKTLTKAGAFTAYTIVAGDLFYLYSPSSPPLLPSLPSGTYTVVSKTNDVLTLGTAITGLGPGITDNRTDVAGMAVTPDATILGPDGIPWTLDDGLKPRVGSILCGADNNGKDIGAYSCDIDKVLETSVGKPTDVVIQ